MLPRPSRDQLARVSARLTTQAQRCDDAARALAECGLATPVIADVIRAVEAEGDAMRAVVQHVIAPALGATVAQTAEGA